MQTNKEKEIVYLYDAWTKTFSFSLRQMNEEEFAAATVALAGVGYKFRSPNR